MSLAAFFRLFRKRPRSTVQKVYAPEFSVRALSLVQGSTVQTTVTFRRSDYTGTITPTISGLPSGVSGAFSPSTLDASTLTTTLTLTATGGASIVSNDPFTVSCTATGSPDLTGNSDTATVTVTASATPAIAIAASKSSTTALQGQTDSFDVTLARTNYTGDVTVAVTGLPTGASATISPNPLTGGAVTAGVVIANDVAASTVTNDAYTVNATGSGVSDATPVNMTHTITSPNVTRGVPSSSFVKGDQFAYANTAALRAVIIDGEGTTAKQNQFCLIQPITGSTPWYSDRNLIEMSSDLTLEGHNVMRVECNTAVSYNPARLQMYVAGYTGAPTTNRSGGVNTAFTNFGAYVVVAYSSGFTPAGSGATNNAYKLTAVGMANYNGRAGIEWTSTSSYSYTCGLSGWGPDGPANNGNGTARPYTVTNASGIWTVPQWVCHYWEVRALDADQFQYRHWTWLYGSEPTVSPQATLTYSKTTSGLASFPTYNRIALGENMNQTAANRYMPSPSYVYWGDVRVYDLDYIDNPLNLY